MIIFILCLLAILALAIAVAATVMMGMQGYFRDRYPRLAAGLGVLARHLNGEADMPEPLEEIFSKPPKPPKHTKR